jgi:hypothetical protein
MDLDTTFKKSIKDGLNELGFNSFDVSLTTSDLANVVYISVHRATKVTKNELTASPGEVITNLFLDLENDIKGGYLMTKYKDIISNLEQEKLALVQKLDEANKYKIYYDMAYKLEHGK